MRQIFTQFIFLVLLFTTVNAQDSTISKKAITLHLSGKVGCPPGLLQNAIASATTPIAICRKPIGDPLYVVDGVIAKGPEIKDLDPNNIESIEILKEAAEVTLYCNRGVQGVIIITTKNKGAIKINDAVSGEPVPAATIDLVYGKRKQHSLRLLSDSLGQVTINEIKPGTNYELQVSSIGYKTYTASLSGESVKAGYSILLQRNYSGLKEVVVLSPRNICHRDLTYCMSKVVCDCLDEIKTVGSTTIDSIYIRDIEPKLAVYPNPVLRSQQLNIEFENVKESKIMLKLFSLDGKLIGVKEYAMIKGKNKINFPINSQITAGIYIIQFISEENKLIRTEQLIIQ